MEGYGNRGREIIAGPHESAKRHFTELADLFGYSHIDTAKISEDELGIILLGDNDLPLPIQHHEAFIEQTFLHDGTYSRDRFTVEINSAGFPQIKVRVRDGQFKQVEAALVEAGSFKPDFIAQSFAEAFADEAQAEFEVITNTESGWIGRVRDTRADKVTRDEAYLFAGNVVERLYDAYPDIDWEARLCTEETPPYGYVLKFTK